MITPEMSSAWAPPYRDAGLESRYEIRPVLHPGRERRIDEGRVNCVHPDRKPPSLADHADRLARRDDVTDEDNVLAHPELVGAHAPVWDDKSVEGGRRNAADALVLGTGAVCVEVIVGGLRLPGVPADHHDDGARLHGLRLLQAARRNQDGYPSVPATRCRIHRSWDGRRQPNRSDPRQTQPNTSVPTIRVVLSQAEDFVRKTSSAFAAVSGMTRSARG